MADSAFRTEHADRLARADTEARANYRANPESPEADTAATAWTHSEAERINAEHDLHGGDKALAAAGKEAADYVHRAGDIGGRGNGAEAQHEAAMGRIMDLKANAAKKSEIDALTAGNPRLQAIAADLDNGIAANHGDALEHLQSIAAGHVKEAPHEALDELTAVSRRNSEEVGAHADALHAREVEAHAALSNYNAHRHDDIADESDVVLESNEDHFEHTHPELGGATSAIAEALGRDAPPEHDDPETVPEHAAHPADAPTPPGDEPDPEEHITEGLEERPKRSDYDTDADYNSDHKQYEQEHAALAQAQAAYKAATDQYTADKAEYDAGHEAHAASMRTHAEYAQAALERLHAQQLDTHARLKEAEKSHAKAATASSKEAEGLEAGDLVNHKAFAGHARDFGTDEQGHVITSGDMHDPEHLSDEKASAQYQSAYETADREVERAQARDENDDLAMPDYEGARDVLDEEMSSTAAAVKALSKVSGRAPVLGKKKPASTKTKKHWEREAEILLKAIANSPRCGVA